MLVLGVIISSWLIVIGDKFPQPGSSNITSEQWRSFSLVAGVGFTGVSALMTTVLSIQNTAVQRKTSQDIEKLKKLLDEGIKAYIDLYDSAINYYRELEPLSTGNFNLMSIESAETKMKKVEASSLFVSKEYYDEWMNFWQSARYIKERVDKEIRDSENRKNYWREEETAKKLAGHLNKLKELAIKQFS